MLYRHKYFKLDTDSKTVFDENGKQLAFTEHLFKALLFLCERGEAGTDELGDFINGGESDRFHDHNVIRQYKYRINNLLGYDVVRYRKQLFSIDGEVVAEDGESSEEEPAREEEAVGVSASDAPDVPDVAAGTFPGKNSFAMRMFVFAVVVLVVVLALTRKSSMSAKPESSDMVPIPEGEFLMGSTEAQIRDAYETDGESYLKERYLVEYPQRKVFAPKFSIDRKEVSNAEYAVFAEATNRSLPEVLRSQDLNAPNQPVVGVDWNEADAYCAWAGKRLPTEAEWEKAARGTDGRLYLWGNAWDPAKDNHGDGSILYGTDESDGFKYTAPVATELGVSPYGVLNMSGNASEWVSDDFNPYPGNDKYSSASLNKEMKVIKGGSFDDSPGEHRPASRIGFPKDFRGFDYGFRCAKN